MPKGCIGTGNSSQRAAGEQNKEWEWSEKRRQCLRQSLFGELIRIANVEGRKENISGKDKKV